MEREGGKQEGRVGGRGKAMMMEGEGGRCWKREGGMDGGKEGGRNGWAGTRTRPVAGEGKKRNECVRGMVSRSQGKLIEAGARAGACTGARGGAGGGERRRGRGRKGAA